MLQAAKHSPRCLQTLPCLSHVLIVNLFLSVKITGSQWQTAAQHWAVSTGHKRGRWARMPTSRNLFLAVWSETFNQYACWRSFCRTLAVLLMLPFYSPLQFSSCKAAALTTPLPYCPCSTGNVIVNRISSLAARDMHTIELHCLIYDLTLAVINKSK